MPPFFPSREERGLVFGRGACDAKGILAAQVAAAFRQDGRRYTSAVFSSRRSFNTFTIRAFDSAFGGVIGNR